MRLGTFNLLHGRSLTDGRVDAARLRDAVAALDVDVLGIQEVDRNQPRSGGLDLTAEVAAALRPSRVQGPGSTGGTGDGLDAGGAVEHRFTPALIGTPGFSWRAAIDADADGGGEPGYGIGLVSRWPVLSWHTVRLGASPLRSPIVIPGSRTRVILLRDEPRALLAAVLDSPVGPITVGTTHLSFVPGWNLRQLRRVVRAMRTLPGPRVLLGDLNIPAHLAWPVAGWTALARVPTYPTDSPRIQFDHVLADPRDAERLPPVRSVDAPRTALSDHRPLVVELG